MRQSLTALRIETIVVVRSFASVRYPRDRPVTLRGTRKVSEPPHAAIVEACRRTRRRATIPQMAMPMPSVERMPDTGASKNFVEISPLWPCASSDHGCETR